MGGQEDPVNSRRNNNTLIWSAILDLTKEHLDEFPFSAREVVRRVGTIKSHATITRSRNGLAKIQQKDRNKFLNELRKEVKREEAHTGEIGVVFCHRMGALIVAYCALFALDVITDGHRNTKAMLNEVQPFILEKYAIRFGGEFYQLLSDWHAEGFTRDLLSTKYGGLIHQLFKKYQKTRPDMTVTTSRPPGDKAPTRAFFNANTNKGNPS